MKAAIKHSASSSGIREYARRLLDIFNVMDKSTASQTVEKTVGLIEPLTSREMEILELLAKGYSNKVIAEKLVITVRTVKKHTSNIYDKFNVSSRTQAVAYAARLAYFRIVNKISLK